MSYMGYYFYPDAVASIDDNPDGGKKRPRGWKSALLILALVALSFVILLLV